MGRVRQTLERRQLGLALQRLRTDASSSRQEAADALGKARSRIAELEEGKSTVTADNLAVLLDFYGVVGDERETVLALAAEARKRQPRRPYTDVLPRAYQRFADLEASASEISSYEPSIIPGLLQSPGYVRAVMEDAVGIWWEASDSELDQRVTFRLDRQARALEATSTKSLRFVVTEEALQAIVGTPEVTQEQCRHIMRLTTGQADLSVRVLPADTNHNPARGGGFTVFGFGGKGSPVGFSSTVFGPSTYFDEETETAMLLRAFERLHQLALSDADSLRLINRIAEKDDHAPHSSGHRLVQEQPQRGSQ